jgi:hypothetical protein
VYKVSSLLEKSQHGSRKNKKEKGEASTTRIFWNNGGEHLSQSLSIRSDISMNVHIVLTSYKAEILAL